MDDHPATDLEAAWSELHEATPSGWFVGRPSFHHDLDSWEQYAFDTTEKAVNGNGSGSGPRSPAARSRWCGRWRGACASWRRDAGRGNGHGRLCYDPGTTTGLTMPWACGRTTQA